MLIAKNIELREDMSMRHLLIAGATGGGKSVTLQTITEHFSQRGIPVIVTDVKGDISGIEFKGEPTSKVLERIKTIGIKNFQFHGNPVRKLDVYSNNGKSIKTTVQKIGPALMSRLLNLSEAQQGSLLQLFSIAKKYNIEIGTLADLFSMATYVIENEDKFSGEYGRISTTSYGALQRSILLLKENNDDVLFCKKSDQAFNVEDFFCQDEDGHGVISIIDATKLVQNTMMYSTLMLYLLTELYNRLPEVANVEVPKAVIAIDEAHTLFSATPKVLQDAIERVIRLIRSKGICIILATQSPGDLADNALAQIGNKIIHAVRAFTPREQKAVRALAQTFRQNGNMNIESVLMNLKTGEALISVLDKDGVPSIAERALIAPPQSRFGSSDYSPELFQRKQDTKQLFLSIWKK